VIQTLERYYIAIALVQKNGSGKLCSKTLEEQCTLMAQRISILHGLNSPEFFDKALFRNLINELVERNGLRKDDEGMLHIGDAVERIAKDADSLLNAQLRQSILQVTLNQKEKSETE
jgi:glycerol-3-phosphate O-acyltransferase